jgi:hypothetical protein
MECDFHEKQIISDVVFETGSYKWHYCTVCGLIYYLPGVEDED